MSLYCNFYDETFDGEAWRVGPSGIYPFLTLNVKDAEYDPLASLFFWPNALIPFCKGWPLDALKSELCMSLKRYEGTIAWLSLEDLFLDDWAVEEILVTNRVMAPMASAFGDGSSPFPEVELQRRGMTPQEVQRLRCGCVAESRVSRLWGRGMHELRQVVTDEDVAVTWTDSIAGCVGASTHLAFQALKGRGQNTRILVLTA